MKLFMAKTRPLSNATPSVGSVSWNTLYTAGKKNNFVVKPVSGSSDSSLRSSLFGSKLVKLEPYGNDVSVRLNVKNTFTVLSYEKKTTETKENDTTTFFVSKILCEEPDVRLISDDALERIRSQGSTVTFGGVKGPLIKPTNKPQPASSISTRQKKSKALSPPVHQKDSLPDSQLLVGKSKVRNIDTVLVPKVNSDLKSRTRVSFKSQENKPRTAQPISQDTSKLRSDNILEPKKSPEVKNGDDFIVNYTKTPEASKTQHEELVNNEETEILQPSSMLGNKTSVWQKTSPASIVFDFRGKTVQANIAMESKAFGTSSNLNVKQNVNLTNGLVNGLVSGRNYSKKHNFVNKDGIEEAFDADEICPVVSRLVFVGENTKVGKSAFLTTRNKNLKIQFDQRKTALFVYPSENNFHSFTKANLERPSGSNLSDRQDFAKTSHRNNDKFSSHTSTVLNPREDKFQLGVSHLLHPKPPSNEHLKHSSFNNANNLLKPAEAGNTSSWSSEILF
ncbi:uncharacterized protein LOC143223691 isoform X2 [Tachypleus tridentatus]|uniref:uncharacterized protein LOC143223691 isoform X2 n=1 Tax=Tachypleus tridentatus TaxID=6853 RepID=UPI003FD3D46A